MIRCIKLWTGADEKSHFVEGLIDLEPGARAETLSVKCPITSASFHETDADPKLGWHPDQDRQLVITLSGTLDFQTRDGEHFVLRPGDILFAEDTVGSGHSWKLTDDQPWRRAYVILAPGAAVPFQPRSAA